MNFLNTWGGVAAMFLLGAATFAYTFWSRAAREKAIGRDGGLKVTRLGRGLILGGLIMGGSCPFFEELPPVVPLQDIVGATVLGVAIGLYAARRMTAKWDSALRESQALPPRVLKWWASRWAILGMTITLLLFSLLYPNAVDLLVSALGNFGAASGYLLSGLFLAYGLVITLWATRREREYGRPIKLPLVRG